MPLAPGHVLNSRYRIVKMLGQGGFGAIYRAWDLNLKRPCAVKENLDISQEARQQFEREARILANLSHTNLARAFDYFSIVGQGQYFVMDFVEGEDLQAMLERAGGPLPVAKVLPWIEQVFDALSHLHSQNPPIIHRDVKPSNIKITPQGQAVLVDFGIAKVFDPVLQTTIGARGVTPGYSPPEQYGQGLTDALSDIYALGATLYTLLTGQAPADSVAIATGNAPPPLPAHSINPKVSAPLSSAIERAMQPDRLKRFSSSDEFKAALIGSLTQPTVSASHSSIFKPKSASRSFLVRDAHLPYWLLALLTIPLIFIAVLLVSQNGIRLSASDRPSQTESQPLLVSGIIDNPAQTITPTRTSIPTQTATLASTPTISATQTEVPTPSLIPEAGFGDIQFCSDPDCYSGPEFTFRQGIEVIYFMFPYQNMESGMAYGRKWYVNDQLYLDYKCTWGADWPTNGVFKKRVYDYNLGLAPGTWYLEIFMEEQLQASATFTVTGSPRFEAFLENYHCNDRSPSLP